MTFETGDVPFAGTDATVFVQMFGDKGTTEKIEFVQEKNSPRFEKGRIDKFAVETTDIGKVTNTSLRNFVYVSLLVPYRVYYDVQCGCQLAGSELVCLAVWEMGGY